MDVLAEPMPHADTLLERVVDVCPFPAAAQRLMALTQDDKSRIDAIAAVVASDPVLTAQVLRIANSAAFRRGGAGPVVDLQRALVVMGIEPLRTLAGAMALLSSFATHDELALDLHALSVVAGTIVSTLAPPTDGTSASVPFVCGLLSEIGALACVVVDGPAYVTLWQRTYCSEEGWPADPSAVREALELNRYRMTTRELGARLLRRHSIPDTIALAVQAPPWQSAETPLLHRATAFARAASATLVHSAGLDDATIGGRLDEIATRASLEQTGSKVRQQCIASAVQAGRSLSASRD